MENKFTVVHWGAFSFDKDGTKIRYYQLVASTKNGYLVKKLNPRFYEKLVEWDEFYSGHEVQGFLYDEFGRVADVVE